MDRLSYYELVERLGQGRTGVVLQAPPDGPPAGEADGDGAHLSPEQAQGRQADTRSDVFSFGALLDEMVTGRNALARDSRSAMQVAVLRDEPEQARRPSVEVPPSWSGSSAAAFARSRRNASRRWPP